MIAEGLRDEVAALLAEPAGLGKQAAQALGYAEMIEHLEGRCSLGDAVEQIKISTRQFARRQHTWFRRFRETHWFDVAEDATVDGMADGAVAYIRL